MSLDAKVVWSEGMFLRTQHFQQQDRYVERLIRDSCLGLRSYGWGFGSLRLDHGSLQNGKIAIAEAVGRFPDGTPFDIPETVDHPPALELDSEAREGTIYLALAEQQAGAKSIDPIDANDSGARYRGNEYEVRDTIAGFEGREPIEVAKLKLRLLHESQDLAGYVTLGLTRIKGVQPDNTVLIDGEFIPPGLTIGANETIPGFLEEIDGRLNSIAADRLGYVLQPQARGTAEVQDLLVLQLVNRFHPVLHHLLAQRHGHPEDIYAFLLSLTGEAATFGANERRPPELPVYEHGDPRLCFRPLMQILRGYLAEVARPERKAVPIPLRKHRQPVWTTEFENMRLLAESTIVLAVQAAVPAERLRQLLPRQTKIGPVEELQELVVSALPGIELTPLAVAPRQVPYHAGMVY
ncbi:MAG: type VI secretion system baseplate subunit TssK, partial [Pseudomonadota bacterium]